MNYKFDPSKQSFSDLFDDPSIAAMQDIDNNENIEDIEEQDNTSKSYSQSNSQIKSILDDNNNEA
jgi:hypothetical protein